MKRILLYLSVALALAGCTTKEDFVLFHETNISEPNAEKQVIDLTSVAKYEYKIQPHDRISITMYNHPELGTTSAASQRQDTTGVLVDANGYVRLPLVKNVHVAGLSQRAAQQKIEKAYSAFLEDAELYLEVLNKRAYILGEVRKPGEVMLFNEKTTLLQLLAKAGDLTDSANRHAIVILKNRYNKVYTETVDLTGTNSIKLANLMIYPNDIVYVAPNDIKSINVGISETNPGLQLIGNIIQPAVQVKYLND
ncbi:polysaccharide export protein, BexD/CtrA/VexA family [Sulfurovum sp. TSL6]|uniref:polysaccharide biosynthesis/export family protein n=1 Tax=Sulfurovum sp. TSL6 TaxID=2826995 RepID=UPI001CC3EC04|nr:polysaccharide biosynthesis/export family protein [Sulfurovum sp. TSL6]GIU00458.1 polysaccharide export protein, BexD/CtrA/VexA family [Sulfurovum sp. TSL6]